MTSIELKTLLGKINSDESKDMDEKINLMLSLRGQYAGEEEHARLVKDADVFSTLIKIVEDDNEPHIHDHILLKLYVLLAETYVELEDYRRLKEIAHGVLGLIRHEVTPWEAMEDTMPRIIDAVGESVFNHALYELLLRYVRAAFVSGRLDTVSAGRIRRLLKLRVLLNEGEWPYSLFNKDLQDAISKLLTSGELLKIILNPQIGHLRKDPVEYTWEWENIYYDVEDKLNERFANAPRQMGFCFLFWRAKQEMLEKEYGILWRSPSLMNPHMIFD